MSDDELPVGWVETTLGVVTDYGSTRKIEPENLKSGSWILELEDIEKETSKLLTRVFLEHRQSKSTKNQFGVGDVLYGKLRPYLNKVLIADQPGYCTTEIVPLKGSSIIDNRFLFYWLKHPAFIDYVSKESHGMNMPRLGTETGKIAPIPLAPLSEQKRIADKLDTLLAQLDSCRTHLDRMPTILKRFRQSVLASATTGRLTEDWREAQGVIYKTNEDIHRLSEFKQTEIAAKRIRKDLAFSVANLIEIDEQIPESWGVVNLASLASKITDGEHITPKRVNSGKFLLSARNILNGQIVTHDVDYVDEDEFTRIRKRCDPDLGDVLISCSGSVGRIALVDKSNTYVMVRSAAMVRPLPQFVHPSYLCYSLQSRMVQKQILVRSKSTAQANLFLGEMQQLVISYPPLPEQDEIVRQVEFLLALADQLEARYQSAMAKVDKLAPALLAKAFRGELVPQDPADESASVLLERIRAERAMQATTKAIKSRPIYSSPEDLK